jgi:hypothetical protein
VRSVVLASSSLYPAITNALLSSSADRVLANEQARRLYLGEL